MYVCIRLYVYMCIRVCVYNVLTSRRARARQLGGPRLTEEVGLGAAAGRKPEASHYAYMHTCVRMYVAVYTCINVFIHLYIILYCAIAYHTP